jgi:hypothetical protein
MANYKKPATETAPPPNATAKAAAPGPPTAQAPVPAAAKAPVKAAEKKPVKKAATKATEKKATKKTVGRKPAAEKKTAAATAKKPAAKKAATPKVRYEDVFAMAKSRVKTNKGSASKIKKKVAATFEILEAGKEKDFYILIDGGKVTLQKYRYDAATIWIKGTAENIGAVMDNKVKFSDAVAAGSVEIFGTADPESAKDIVLFVAAIF